MDDTPVLSLDFASFCIGDSWKLKVSNGVTNASIRLSGTGTGQSWEIPSWHTTDADGSYTETGLFTEGTAGNHTLRVEIGGSFSNTVSFVVSRCR